ncbi:TlpA family protein disulfide reductase [Sphingobacterium tabacisoli]|uniref:TlpA family protein disulfide reductase n=1 Tax=Sphingobacterium tabacisoli TaxID=2044855 RepID=A0ABW5L6K2_9SPHI|nr:TlpA disulfide reductase family protein [Sphingobacterium tabacisoli]
MKKLVLLFMLVWGSAYGQQQDPSKLEERFYAILNVEDAESFYEKLIATAPDIANNATALSQIRGQLAVDWLIKGNIEKYQFYKQTKPTFTPLQLFELSNYLEEWGDSNTNIPLIQQLSNELLVEIQKGIHNDQFSRESVLLAVNAVANARLGNLQLAKDRIKESNEKDVFGAIPYFRNSKANYLNRYAIILSADGEHQRALDTLSKAVREGNSTIALRKTLRDVYLQVNGRTKDVDTYIKLLQEEAYQKIYKEVQKDWQAAGRLVPSIPLKDMNGKEIVLSDYKGKIVVIDFWSTACKPCVAAFPAFEHIVDKYKDEPFELFVINVGEDVTTARNYMKKKGYVLDVLFDNNEAIFNALEALGTPQKFIIDTEGRIRLTGIGYAGSDDKEYLKLKAMIELTKANTESF